MKDQLKDAVLNGLSKSRDTVPIQEHATHAILNALMFLVLRTPDKPTTGAPSETEGPTS